MCGFVGREACGVSSPSSSSSESDSSLSLASRSERASSSHAFGNAAKYKE